MLSNYRSIRGYFWFKMDQSYPGWSKLMHYWAHVPMKGA